MAQTRQALQTKIGGSTLVIFMMLSVSTTIEPYQFEPEDSASVDGQDD